MLPDALVDAFVAGGAEDQPLVSRQLDGDLLAEGPALRGAEHNMGDRGHSTQFLDRTEPWLGAHDHAGAAAVRRVVDAAMFVLGRVAQVMQIDGNDAGLDRAAHDGRAQYPVEGVGENCNNIYLHWDCISVRCRLRSARQHVRGGTESPPGFRALLSRSRAG